MRFLIHAPPYVGYSGGIRVMHRLCHMLRILGHEAYINTCGTNPEWNTPYASALGDDFVNILTEIVEGIPKQCAGKVIHWCGNAPGHMGGQPRFAPGELVIFHDEVFREAVQAATDEPLDARHCITLQSIEPHLFFPDPLRVRDRTVLYIGKPGEAYRRKYNKQPFFNVPYHGNPIVNVERFPLWPETRWDLAELLRRTDVVYSYDVHTALVEEAVICGAKAFVWDKVGVVEAWREILCDTENYAARYYDLEPACRIVALAVERWG